MIRFNLRHILSVATVLLSVATGAAQAEHQSVGLVLSGGGAKGIAHIGVIQALEDNDIPIDYITGTSMGAIVGGLYAAGYTPDEMMKLILSRGFSYWSTGKIDPDLVYRFTAEEPSPSMISIPIINKADSLARDSTAVPASLISPLPMSYAFMQLFAQYNAQCGSDFNNLFVPFRCCASDAAAHHKVVLSKGDFADAIRSSMSFPIVFQPTEFEGMLLYDGGLYDNFPADVMRDDFAPDFVIGVDVSTIEEGPQTSIMDQLDNLIVQGSDYYLDPSNGIKIKFDLNRFGLLDFPKAKAIYKIGYDKAISMIDSIKGRIHTRTPKMYRDQRRAAFKAKTPYLRFDSVSVSGATPAQCRYIESMFNYPDTFGIDQATASYYRAVSTGKLADLQPHAIYNDSTGLFRLNLKASVKDDFKIGIGGYVTSSSSSYVYLSAGYSTFSFNSISAKLSAWIGQSYMAGRLNARSMLPTGFPSSIDLDLVAQRNNYFHSDKLFFESDQPSFVHSYEYFGRLKWAVALNRLARIDIGLGGAHLYDSFYASINNSAYEPFRDHCKFNLAQAFVRYNSSTLNDINYPSAGAEYRFTGMAVAGNYKQDAAISRSAPQTMHPRWLQFESITKNYFDFSRHFSLGVESDVMLSTRKLMPDYNVSIVAAPAFNPTPASHNEFNPAFRANSFVAASIVPVWGINESLSARLNVSGFLPLRRIEAADDGSAVYSRRWLHNPELFSELTLTYSLPFATVAAYCNYSTKPSHNWNVGIAFGVFMHAPEFLR